MALFSRSKPPSFDRLEPGHAEACAILHASSFAHGWSPVDFERLIAARTSWSDAAFEGASLIGFILSRGAAGESEVLTIVTNPAHRRRGIGRGLLDRHIRRLTDARFDTLFLDVNEDNVAARKLYAAFGFAEVGRRPSYYDAGPAGLRTAALVLRRSLT